MQEISINRIKEIWNHTGFQKYFRNTGWIFVSRIASLIISFIATAVIARNLGPKNYGELNYAISFVGLLSFFYSLGIDNVLYRDILKYPSEKNKYLGSAFVIKIITGILSILLILFSAFFIVKDKISLILIFILSGTLIFNSFQIINYEFQSKVKSKYPSISSTVITLILNVLKILVIFLGKGVIYLSLILLLESILYTISYTYLYKEKIGGNIFEWKFDKKISINLIKDSWPFIFTSIFAMIYTRIDQVFIKHMIDTNSVGLYEPAVRLTEVWYFIPNIIIASFFPAIINAKITSITKYKSRLIKLATLLFVSSLSIALFTTILAPYIIKIIYGNAFTASIIVLQIYIWSNIGTFLNSLISTYLTTENSKKTLFFLNLIPMIINVILNLILIPQHGIVGSAFATLISYSTGPIFILFIIVFKLIKKHV
jgi:O-antigen/teichoic acid export membrane protein